MKERHTNRHREREIEGDRQINKKYTQRDR